MPSAGLTGPYPDPSTKTFTPLSLPSPEEKKLVPGHPGEQLKHGVQDISVAFLQFK